LLRQLRRLRRLRRLRLLLLRHGHNLHCLCDCLSYRHEICSAGAGRRFELLECLKNQLAVAHLQKPDFAKLVFAQVRVEDILQSFKAVEFEIRHIL
jgi:hypothetical protein